MSFPEKKKAWHLSTFPIADHIRLEAKVHDLKGEKVSNGHDCIAAIIEMHGTQ